MGPNPLLDLSAGLSSASIQNHPSGPPAYGPTTQAERAFSAASTFLSGIMAISATQFLGAPLKMLDPKFYEAYMAFTKQSFGVLITTMTQWWSPTIVRVSGDTSIPKQLFKREDGSLQCKFPKRLVMMANHQLYTDWLYLWWVAYTNSMHGYIYIILKESLKNIPIIGWGCQFYNFIFLARNWEQDKPRFQNHLAQLNNPDDPMWLLIFPEGTNLSKVTKEKSQIWAKKQNLQDMKHQLLPRSRGLQFCLKNLRGSTEWLYDCTIGYEGIPPGEFGQDIFTLRSSMFEGRPPKSVNMHFRRFKIADIPIDNDKAFDVWLRNRWREKDYLLEHFARYDRFPKDENWLINQMKNQPKGGKKEIKPMPAKTIETQIKSNSLEEFLSIFAPLSSVLAVLFLFYGGTNPNDLLAKIGEAMQTNKQIALVRDDTDPDNPLKIESRIANAATMLPSMDNVSAAGKTAAQAQRNLMQKYIEAVRPQIQKSISLPENALKPANAGEQPFKNKLKPAAKKTVKSAPAKPGTVAPKKAASVTGTKPAAGTPQAKKPASMPALSRTLSLDTVPSTSTAKSKKPGHARSVASTSNPGPLASRPNGAKQVPTSTKPLIKSSAAVKPVDSKKPAAPPSGKSVPNTMKPLLPARPNGQLKTFKVDQATYDKLKGTSQKQSSLQQTQNKAPESIAAVPKVKSLPTGTKIAVSGQKK